MMESVTLIHFSKHSRIDCCLSFPFRSDIQSCCSSASVSLPHFYLNL